MQALRGEEEWARQMVEAALGVPVVQHDDGSTASMHDLSIHHGDGRMGAVEVVAAADAASIELWKLVNGDDDLWVEPGLVGGWAVHLEPRARAKKLRANLPALLRDLEEAGTTWLEVGEPALGGHQEWAARLGITSMSQLGTNYPGSIYPQIDIPMERSAGWVDGSADEAAGWVGGWLRHDNQADVLAKLARSGSEDRHAFIICPGFTTAPFAVANLLIGCGGVPTLEPDLPPEVTHVWLVTTWSLATGFRWDPKGGWSRFDKLVD